LNRNIKTVNRLLDGSDGADFPLNPADQKLFWVIQKLHRQQCYMHKNHVHKVDDRIVRLSQPHVRPIVRGKAGRDVEFGAKISVAIVDKELFLDHLSWDNYNEGQYLKAQVERFRERFGYYPAAVLGDKIYGNRDNRKYLKSLGIEFLGHRLGRRPRMTPEIRKLRSEYFKRNRIEGGFGLAKRRFGMDRIKARRPDTSVSWICSILFVMNLIRWLMDHFFVRISEMLYDRCFALIGYLKEQLRLYFDLLFGGKGRFLLFQ